MTDMPRGIPLPRLRDARRRAVLTQEELAERAGVSVATISKLEQAGADGTAAIATIRRLAAALSVEPQELMATPPPPPPA